MNHEFPNYHEDTRLFREALTFTQAETGFSARLIEKDYYCSLLLQDMLATHSSDWAFKGGTALSKVHSGFYRMSEDLDFAYSVPPQAARARRSKLITAMKEHLARLADRLACFHVAAPLRGHNSSTQYAGSFTYHSAVTAQDESIKIEFALREPILEAIEHLPASTLLVDPFRRTAAIAAFHVPVLSYREAYGEKVRAALTRRIPAIRDFYDIDHGVRTGRLRMDDRHMIDLVRRKLSTPGNDPIDLSRTKHQLLQRQVSAQLRPVLREADFTTFDLNRAFGLVSQIATAVQYSPGELAAPPPPKQE